MTLDAQSSPTLEPVDIVITWVDGASPEHQSKRNAYLSENERRASIQASRFVSGRDLYFCLRSIFKFAPWVSSIYVITDNQTPKIDVDLAKDMSVHLIDHKVIFRDYEDVLPTFNSLAIESLLWRIPQLSEHFIYLNDDFLFTSPLTPHHFFRQGKVVLRGQLKSRPPAPLEDYLWHVWNATMIAGGMDDQGNYYSDTHYPKPMKRSICELQFNLRREEFERNISPRFRKNWQFYAPILHDTFCLKHALAIHEPGGLIEIPAKIRGWRLRGLISKMWGPETLFGCVIDSTRLADEHPSLMDSLYEPVSAPLRFELPVNSETTKIGEAQTN